MGDSESVASMHFFEQIVDCSRKVNDCVWLLTRHLSYPKADKGNIKESISRFYWLAAAILISINLGGKLLITNVIASYRGKT